MTPQSRVVSSTRFSLNITDIEAFIGVADMRSIAKASARLDLNQPAITPRLQNLEDQFGVKRFDRDSRRVRAHVLSSTRASRPCGLRLYTAITLTCSARFRFSGSVLPLCIGRSWLLS